MFKSSKIVIPVILLCILLSFTISCTKNSGDLSAKDNAAGTGQVENKNIPKSLKNKDIRMLIWPATREQYSIDDAEKNFKEKYGGNVYYSDAVFGEMPAKMITAISAGEPYDIVYFNTKEFLRLATKEVIMPIDDYMDLKDAVFDEYRSIMDQIVYKGRHYGIVANATPYLVQYNKDMFENNGIKTPLEYYKEGTWNWDTFEKLAVQFVQDTNGDGVVDQWGYATHLAGLESFVLSNNADYISVNDSGSAELKIRDSKFIDAMQFYQDGVYKHKYFLTKKPEYYNGKVAMVVERANTVNLTIDNIKFGWDIVPFPLGPEAPKGIIAGSSGLWGMSNGAQNPQGAAAFLYILHQLDKTKYAQRMRESFNDDQLRLLKEIGTNYRINMTIEELNKLSNNIWKDLDKGTPVISVLEKYETSFQAQVDEFNKDIQGK